MRIINILQHVQPVNMGITMAATAAAAYLKEKYDADTEIWFPGGKYNQQFGAAAPVQVQSTNIGQLEDLMQQRKLNAANDIIITHGPWNYQTYWGHFLSQRNFKWIFVPHGTLEPWSLRQKWLKKKIYFLLFEKRLLQKANLIQAISSPEQKNLQQLFPNKKTVLIPNGIEVNDAANTIAAKEKIVFVFMARLHHKKGVVPLVKAWLASSLNNNKKYQLIIAGPDDGELKALKKLLSQSQNAEYAGAVYGEEKKALLQQASFFVLPSESEGFPVSLLEAAIAGLVPLITEGCNFPEILNADAAIKTGTNATAIQHSLEYCAGLSLPQIQKLSLQAAAFVKENYNSAAIAEKQYSLYKELLNQF
ncbi:MAG TPA: glycosyltransferase [Chitinophagaceae bacterium]|nr:glycosyltransferase [Chitinophagaceae bacterium]